MGKFRKKPMIVDAEQWLGHGRGMGPQVNRFETVPGDGICTECAGEMSLHGWIGTLEGPMRTCPNDWIITGTKGERHPCKPDVFLATYEPIDSCAESDFDEARKRYRRPGAV